MLICLENSMYNKSSDIKCMANEWNNMTPFNWVFNCPISINLSEMGKPEEGFRELTGASKCTIKGKRANTRGYQRFVDWCHEINSNFNPITCSINFSEMGKPEEGFRELTGASKCSIKGKRANTRGYQKVRRLMPWNQF